MKCKIFLMIFKLAYVFHLFGTLFRNALHSLSPFNMQSEKCKQTKRLPKALTHMVENKLFNNNFNLCEKLSY
jgi:hypothetical protein